jgi:GntR family transcriptional regulator/MocR family aminotransferase
MMVRQPTPIPPGVLSTLEAGGGPAYRQVYAAIRQAILTSELEPGTRLSSSRVLAEELGVSRSTTFLAYDMLLSEGYLYGVSGSGTYVAEILPEEFAQAEPPRDTDEAVDDASALSRRGLAMASGPMNTSCDVSLSRTVFNVQADIVDSFPLETWARLAARRYRSRDRGWLRWGEKAGYRPLRESIAAYLRSSRGVSCSPDQVVIFSGLSSATSFIAQVLVDPGGQVWVEDPGWFSITAAFQAASAEVVPIQPGAEGFDLHVALRVAPEARVACVMPSCQMPLGMTMSMARRLALLQWAHEHDGWVIENDYNGEFRYRGRPLPALQGLDRHGRTLYLGSFSKVLFPSIRLGYVVVPESILDQFVQARRAFDFRVPVFEQMVVADFMREGHFLRHVRRLRRVHAERQAAFLDAAATELAGLLDILPTDAGMYLVGMLPEGVSEEAAQQAAARHGVIVDLLGQYWFRPPANRPQGLVLGYVDFEPEEIRDGVKRLAQALRSIV